MATDKTLSEVVDSLMTPVCFSSHAPVDMTSPDKINWTCPVCGRTKCTERALTAGYITLDFGEHGE